MDEREKITLLAATVKRYVNGYLYSHWNRNRMKPALAKSVVAEMNKIEGQLYEQGMTERQLMGLINYGEVLISVVWTEITESALRHVLKLVFEKEL